MASHHAKGNQSLFLKRNKVPGWIMDDLFIGASGDKISEGLDWLAFLACLVDPLKKP